jgi:hypothetical protein
MAEVCLIYEVNCYHRAEPPVPASPATRGLFRSLFGVPDPHASPPESPQNFGSVWVKAGPLAPDEEYYEVARKVAGPLPSEEATAAVAALREVLEAVGVSVIEETVADD